MSGTIWLFVQAFRHRHNLFQPHSHGRFCACDDSHVQNRTCVSSHFSACEVVFVRLMLSAKMLDRDAVSCLAPLTCACRFNDFWSHHLFVLSVILQHSTQHTRCILTAEDEGMRLIYYIFLTHHVNLQRDSSSSSSKMRASQIHLLQREQGKNRLA